MLLEQLLTSFAIFQALLATFRAASRLRSIIQPKPPPLGPLITRDDSENPFLYEVTSCFRQAVQLGLYTSDYDSGNTAAIQTTTLEEEGILQEPTQDELYSLSLVPSTISHNHHDDDNNNNKNQKQTIMNNKRKRMSWQVSLLKQQQKSERNVLMVLDPSTVQLTSTIVVPLEPVGPILESLGYNNNNQNNTMIKKNETKNETKNEKDSTEMKSDETITSDSVISTDLNTVWSCDYVLDREEWQEPMVVKLKAFAPQTFQNLRTQCFGIRNFEQAILANGPFVSFTSNSKGAARVGGLFFATQNGLYMIKTIKQEEIGALLYQLLPKYYTFMQQYGSRSLLTRLCGMYQVEYPAKHNKKPKQYTFIIMNAVFPPTPSLVARYDLKGSTVGRTCRDRPGPHAILKDLDLVQKTKHERKYNQQSSIIQLKENKQLFMTQLKQDVELLRQCNLIDYSLLVGIATTGGLVTTNHTNHWRALKKFLWTATIPIRLLAAVPTIFISKNLWNRIVYSMEDDYWNTDTNTNVKNASTLSVLPGTTSQGQRAVFYMGLIDFLQPFTFAKRMEYQVKSALYEKDTYSCVPPEVYAKRFLEFIDTYIQ